jgi:hypothetical protein
MCRIQNVGRHQGEQRDHQRRERHHHRQQEQALIDALAAGRAEDLEAVAGHRRDEQREERSD